MSALTTFTYFKKLPLELRLLIWDMVETPYTRKPYESPQIHAIRGFRPSKIVMLHPRVDVSKKAAHFVKRHRLPQEDSPKPLKVGGGIFLSTTAQPVHPVLHACAESRRYILKKRRLTYAFHTYVKVHDDIFFLDCSRGLNREDRGLESAWALLQDKELAAGVEKIALTPKFEDDYIPKLVALLKPRLPNLREVHFISAHFDWNPATMFNEVYVDPRCRGRTVNLRTLVIEEEEADISFVLGFEEMWKEEPAELIAGGKKPPVLTFHHHLLRWVLGDTQDESYGRLSIRQRLYFTFMPDIFPKVFAP